MLKYKRYYKMVAHKFCLYYTSTLKSSTKQEITKKIYIWQKYQNVTKIRNLKCEKTQRHKDWQISKTQNVTQLKMWQKSLTQNMTKRKNTKCDKPHQIKMWQNSKYWNVTKLKNKLEMWQNSKTQNVTKLKMRQNSKCDKTQTKNVTKLKNSKCDKTQNETKLKKTQKVEKLKNS